MMLSGSFQNVLIFQLSAVSWTFACRGDMHGYEESTLVNSYLHVVNSRWYLMLIGPCIIL